MITGNVFAFYMPAIYNKIIISRSGAANVRRDTEDTSITFVDLHGAATHLLPTAVPLLDCVFLYKAGKMI